MRISLDTNILIYWISNQDQQKKTVIKELFEASFSQNSEIHIGSQVLRELAFVMLRKFSKSPDEVATIVEHLIKGISPNSRSVHGQSNEVLLKALSYTKQLKYSFWDSMVLAEACLEGCSHLLSEDLQHGQIIENQLCIINPFSIS